MLPSVRLHIFSTGTMTSALGGFLEGEVGELTYPVPVFIIEHPNGLVAVDSGVNRDRQLAAVRRMAQEQADGATLIFGHDPEQFDRITRDGLNNKI